MVIRVGRHAGEAVRGVPETRPLEGVCILTGTHVGGTGKVVVEVLSKSSRTGINTVGTVVAPATLDGVVPTIVMAYVLPSPARMFALQVGRAAAGAAVEAVPAEPAVGTTPGTWYSARSVVPGGTWIGSSFASAPFCPRAANVTANTITVVHTIIEAHFTIDVELRFMGYLTLLAYSV